MNLHDCVSSLKFSCFWYFLLTWILVSNSLIFCLCSPLSSVKRSVWKKKNIEQLEYYCISTQHRIWSNNTREQIPIFILNYISTNIYSESFNLCFVMSVYKHKIPNVSLFSYFPIDQQTFQIPGPWKRYPLRAKPGLFVWCNIRKARILCTSLYVTIQN